MTKTCTLLFLTALFLYGCSSQKPFYSKKERDWETKKMPDVPVQYSVYLLGGLDEGERDTSNEVLEMLSHNIDRTDSNHAVVFLSDHIYKNGMPDENDVKRKQAEKVVNARLDILANDKGKIFFIAGDHDVIKDKEKRKESISRTKTYVESRLGKKNIFLPEDGCPGPGEVELTDDLVIVPINTQWWLNDKDERNNNCDIKKELDWTNELKDVVDNNQRKNILVLGHHPLFSLGHHGGLFSLKEHIFPLTMLHPALYIPLPIVGSLYPLYRGGVGTKNDASYPPYKALRRSLYKSFAGYNNVTYASAHEPNFQYIKYEKQDFIITNSLNKTEWAGRNKVADFTYASKGFVKLSYLQNGEVWMEIFVPGNKREGEIVYRRRLKDNIYGKQDDSTRVDSSIPLADSTIMIAADENLKVSGFKKIFLGQHHRDAWTTPVSVPVLDLRTEQGGLEIVKKGGGFQTKSLRLKNQKGEEFSLRSVIKYPERLLGKTMKNTLVSDIVKDQTSSTHPYAPYIVDDLSEAAGVLHSNPKMVYIPNDVLLKEYRKDFANTLALFEQRADGNLPRMENFGNAKTAISTVKMLDKLHADNGNGHDEYALLKSRLFDMWINDWDRHEDQWRWGTVDCSTNPERCKLLKAKKEYFVPIPRDRDFAFAKYDGFFPWIAGRKWVSRKFQHFAYDIRDVPGLNFNARNLDHALLTELPKEEWLRIANDLKKELTDEKIEHSIRQLPDTIYKIDGAEITSKLKARRDKINEFAEKYYAYLAKYVDVTGSDKKEIIEVNRINDDSTSVKVYDKEEGDKGRLIYDRTFKTDETKEVRIYAMGGDDIINITGKTRKGILVRVIGGEGKDSITDASRVSGLCKKTKVYDDEKKNKLNLGSEAKDLTSSSKSINEYNFRSYDYNLVAPATFFGYSTDDGVYIGGGVVIKNQGFRKKPYANFQRIVANVATNGGSFNFKYTGDFTHVFGKWGINTDVSVLAPKSTTNFYGLGNETTLLPSTPRIYYRLRYDQVHVSTALKRHLGKYHSIKIGPVYDYIKIENTPGRFISSPEAQPYIQDFEARNSGGGKLEYEVQNIDDTVMTLRGVKWALSATSVSEFKRTSLHPTNLHSELSLYIPLPHYSTIALRAGGSHLLDDFEFYQANTLGGQNAERGQGNLRGYLRGRYAGRSVAYLNADLRITLFRFRTYLFPAQFGVLGFYDRGRVWNDDETSDKWHDGYGGGVWMSPFGMAIVNVSYAVSKEEKLYAVSLGFLF